jgi:hypothetical protein
MRMARTGYLHFALGIELVGVGGYMDLYFFGSRIATVSDPQETFSVHRLLCASARHSNGRSTSLRQNSRKAHHRQTKVRVVYLVKTRG